MPKVKWISPPKQRIDHTRALLKECARQNKMLWKEIAISLDMQPGTLANKLSKGTTSLRLGQIVEIAKVVKCPTDELVRAIEADITQ